MLCDHAKVHMYLMDVNDEESFQRGLEGSLRSHFTLDACFQELPDAANSATDGLRAQGIPVALQTEAFPLVSVVRTSPCPQDPDA